MPYITRKVKQYRLEIDERPPFQDQCAFCGAGNVRDGYVEGRSVAGFDANNSLAFKGHMCFDCMQDAGLKRVS